MMTGLWEGVAIASPSIVINYVLSSVFGIGVTYYLLGQLFERRLSGLFWWAYFIPKSAGDAYLWYALGNGGVGTWVESFYVMWTGTVAILSLVVIFASFRGGVASVGLCSVVCDLFAGATTSSSWTFTNALMGAPLERGFLIDLSPDILLFGLLVVLIAYLVRRPALWLLRWLCRMTGRYWMLWFVVTVIFIASMAFIVPKETISLAPSMSIRPYMPRALVLFASLGLLLRLSLRDAMLRAQVMADCADLARDYERTAREQLRVLDRDRSALEGHEKALARLGGEGADQRLSARIHELEQSYLRLSAGSYCVQPALDAVLTTGASRLRRLGVLPAFTVAAVPAQTAAPAMAALALLNLAADVAAHAEGAEGAEVELRVRGIGERLLLRLEVPASWGVLGARRLLRPVMGDPSTLIRERRKRDRRVVLVLTPAEEDAACIS